MDCSGNIIPVEGSTNILINYKNQVITLPAHIVTTGSDLLGRDWLRHLKLDRHNLFRIKTINETVVSWPTRFPQVFSSSLGKYTGPKVNIAKLPNHHPVFFRERNLPLAIRD